ncbi:MAG: hypothetical protein ACT4OX_01765 [Actinomycetota bacterium]
MAESHGGRHLMASRYTGNVPSNVSKDAKYSVVHGTEGWEVRLIYRLSSAERALVTTGSHPELVELVNEVKDDVNGAPGGAFYINEYKHVLVPTEDGCMYAGRYLPLLTFRFEGQEISATPPSGLSAGDEWPGPRVGTAYVLTADGADIRYRCETRPNVLADRRLSAEVGTSQAARTARQLARHKPGGGRIYINESFECFGPSATGNGLAHIYLGKVDEETWFKEPTV